MIKICKRCGNNKHHNFRSIKKGTLQSVCKDCQSLRDKDYFSRNKEKIISRNVKNKKTLQEYIRKAKEVPCTDCKEEYPYYVMQFDHLDPSTKSFNIGEAIHRSGIGTIQQELDKCEVVCANCHAERTWKRSHSSVV